MVVCSYNNSKYMNVLRVCVCVWGGGGRNLVFLMLKQLVYTVTSVL